MKKIPVIIAVLGLVVGFGATAFFKAEAEKVPTYIFAREVALERTHVPNSIVELSRQDVARFRGLSEALKIAIPDKRPMAPQITSNLVGRLLRGLLGGDSTDLRRARVVDTIYVHSVEYQGKYYNLVIAFHESQKRATQNGWYWLGIIYG
jgi:hypothetical protein